MAAQETAIQNKAFRARRFLREVKAELKKVAWPDRRALSAYTGVVFISVVIVAVVIWLVDSFFTEILKIFMR